MESIIQAVAEYFSPKFKEKLTRCENIDALIKRLEKKAKSIEKKLAEDLSDSEREKLTTKLAVLNVQKEKAEQLLKDSLEES